ncbi:MAG: phytase [candidate division Zixibacteria bacterium]|nr:phytase [candidate division Zixibacteria bacterium]
MGTKSTALVIVLLAGLIAFGVITEYSTGEVDMRRGIKAPEIDSKSWFNTEPLKLKKLKGKLVLVDFWDYTCVNCLRTLPYLKLWHERYADKGLVIIGVHAPEYEFARKENNAAEAVRALGIEYPVVLDNEYETWEKYANRYLPQKYLIDSYGYINHEQIGEGGYRKMEERIQQLLREIDYNMELPPVAGALREIDQPGAICYESTPELYLGYRKARIGSMPELVFGKSEEYTAPEQFEEGFVFLNGLWNVQDEYVKHARKTDVHDDYIGLKYRASEVNMVVSPGEENGYNRYKAYVTLDGDYLTPDEAGDDIEYGHDGETYIIVDTPRLYNLVNSSRYGENVLKVHFKNEGLEVYSFTFGSCVIPEMTSAVN